MHELELLDGRFSRRHPHERVQHARPLEQLIRAGQPLRTLRMGYVEPALNAFVQKHRTVVVQQATLVVDEAGAQRRTSSGTSYQRLRSPTRSRTRHFLDFGSCSIRSHSASARCTTRVCGPSSSDSDPTWSWTRSRFSLTVRHRPQSSAVKLADDVAVDRLAVIAADFVGIEERGDVTQILVVQLHHLELRQQELGQGNRAVIELDASRDWNRVAHLEAADEHVELTLVRAVVEQHPLVALQRIELARGS